MVYTIVIVSSSASTVQNKHQVMNLIFTIFFGWSKGWTLSCMTLNSSRNTHSSSCSCNPPHMTMVSSREYTIEKSDMRPLSNIGKACTGSHFAYSKSSHLLSSHRNSCNFGTEGHRQYRHALCLTSARRSHKPTHFLHTTKRNQHY